MPTPQILVEGQSNLLAATEDVDRAKRVLRTLEEKDLIVRLLDRTLSAPGICVFIGAEANFPDLTDISVVAASYGTERAAPGHHRGHRAVPHELQQGHPSR